MLKNRGTSHVLLITVHTVLYDILMCTYFFFCADQVIVCTFVEKSVFSYIALLVLCKMPI